MNKHVGTNLLKEDDDNIYFIFTPRKHKTTIYNSAFPAQKKKIVSIDWVKLITRKAVQQFLMTITSVTTDPVSHGAC